VASTRNSTVTCIACRAQRVNNEVWPKIGLKICKLACCTLQLTLSHCGSKKDCIVYLNVVRLFILERICLYNIIKEMPKILLRPFCNFQELGFFLYWSTFKKNAQCTFVILTAENSTKIVVPLQKLTNFFPTGSSQNY